MVYSSRLNLTLVTNKEPDLVSQRDPGWELVHAVRHLRLTIADASLRTREEARSYQQTEVEYWMLLGHAHGYQKAAQALRTWVRPDLRENSQELLETMVARAHESSNRDVSTASTKTHTFVSSYSWALTQVLYQIRELSVVHLGHPIY
jgi:hypothetical protein